MFRNLTKILGLVLVGNLPTGVVQSQTEATPSYYSFHPMSVMSLGVGLTPGDLGAAKLRCIDATVVPLEEGALSTQFSISLVTDETQLKTALGLDLNVDASYLTFKGGANYSFKTSTTTNENSVTVVVTGITEYGRKGLKDAKLTDQASKIVTDSARFASTCGTQFVSIERRGASVSAIVTLFGLTKEDRNSLVGGASGGGGSGPFTVSGSTKFQLEFSKAVKSGRALVQIVSTGGVGFGALTDTVTALSDHPGSLEAIKSALAIYLAQFTTTNGVPIGFHTTSMMAFGWEPKEDNLWTLQKAERLRRIVASYRLVVETLDAARAISARTDIRTPILSEQQIRSIADAIPAWERALISLADAHAKCSNTPAGGECADIEPPTNISLVPPIPTPPRGSFRIVADGKMMSEEASRVIVYDTSQPLSERVRIRQSGVAKASQVFVLDGDYLVGATLIFKEVSGVRSVAGLNIIDSGATYDCITDDTISGLMSSIFNFMTGKQMEGKGMFSIRVHDKLGRYFDYDVYQAEWKSSPMFSNIKGKYAIY